MSELCPEMLEMTTTSWKFDNLPGVSKKAPNLIREHQLLEKLHAQLQSMKPMELWNESLEEGSSSQPSESFF